MCAGNLLLVGYRPGWGGGQVADPFLRSASIAARRSAVAFWVASSFLCVRSVLEVDDGFFYLVAQLLSVVLQACLV